MEELENIPENLKEKKKSIQAETFLKKNLLQLLLESISCSSGIEKTDDSSIVENAIKNCKHNTWRI